MRITIEHNLERRCPDLGYLAETAAFLVLKTTMPEHVSIQPLPPGVRGIRGRVVISDGLFVIELADLEPEQAFSTLTHEFVHIAQFLAGRLAKAKHGWTWAEDGRRKVFFPGNTSYYQRPWELEAHSVTGKIKQAVGGAL